MGVRTPGSQNQLELKVTVCIHWTTSVSAEQFSSGALARAQRTPAEHHG